MIMLPYVFPGISYKAQSLWGRVKTTTNQYRTILKTGITLLPKYNYDKNSKNIQ